MSGRATLRVTPPYCPVSACDGSLQDLQPKGATGSGRGGRDLEAEFEAGVREGTAEAARGLVGVVLGREVAHGVREHPP